MPQIPAGWYPDPAPPQPGQPPLVRYWDGRVWTPHVTQADVPSQPAAQPYAPPVAQPYAAAPAAQPYAAAPAAQQYAQPEGGGERPAGWWWRVLAYLIDAFVVNVLATIVSIPAQIGFQRDLTEVAERFEAETDALAPGVAPDFSGFFTDLTDLVADNAVALMLPAAIVVTLYYSLMLKWKGATLGKLAVGLRVRRLAGQEGDALPWSTVIARVLAQFLLPVGALIAALVSGQLAVFLAVAVLYSLYVLLDVLWPLWDSRNQALHDKVARTQVVKLS